MTSSPVNILLSEMIYVSLNKMFTGLLVILSLLKFKFSRNENATQKLYKIQKSK